MLHRGSILVCSAVFAGALLGASSAGAQTTWYVDDDAPNDPGPGDPSVSDPLEDGSAEHPFDAIQEGIDAAADGDTVLVLDGTYTDVGNKNLDFAGRLITARSENGPDTCIIDCEHDGRGFYFHGGETADAIVDGLTVTGAYAERNEAGILCEDASPTIANCILRDNACPGIVCRFASPLISNCAILRNTAGHAGGGISLGAGSARIVDCVIVGNSAGLRGGGMYFRASDARVVGCLFAENHGAEGGGLNVGCGSAPFISNCTVVGNTAAYEGGGICAQASRPHILNCLIAANASDGCGGGVALRSHGGKVANCTIARNTAAAGAGVYAFWATDVVTDCTITGNSATGSAGDPGVGGGVLCYGRTTLRLANGVVWANSAAEGAQLALATLHYYERASLTVSYCDVQEGEAAVFVGDHCTLTWGAGNFDADPLFVDPDGPDDDPNTWEDNDYRLSDGSPCIDAGCNCAVPADLLDLDGDGDTAEYTPFDLDGEGRFFDDPATEDTGSGVPPIVDVGPYEFGGSDPPPCFGDLDGDRDVDSADLAILLDSYGVLEGAMGPDGDMDCDGAVDLTDLAALLSVYGWTCPT
jgi:hypothetical protein